MKNSRRKNDLQGQSGRAGSIRSGLKITKGEFRARLDSLQELIAEAGLDLFIISSFDSIYYLCGRGFEPLERPFFLLVKPEGAPVLLVPKLDLTHMSSVYNIPVENVCEYREYPAPAGQSWPDRLREEIGTARQIGIEPTVRQEIAAELDMFSTRMLPLVERMRLVKSPTEVEMIRRAARYADYGVERLLAASYHGATVGEGFAETGKVTSKILRDLDHRELLTTKVLMATWAAPHSALPHSIPALEHTLERGPHVALVLTRVNGYAAESERTYFTESPNQEAKHAFAAMMEARRIAFGMIRPGVSCEDLDGKVSEFLEGEGYGGVDKRLHRIGHGIGLGNHEAPWIAEGSTDRLERNMVISVEPGIYLKGIGGFRHSDTVLVTSDGPELLTNAPTDIGSLTLKASRAFRRLKGRMVKKVLGIDR